MAAAAVKEAAAESDRPGCSFWNLRIADKASLSDLRRGGLGGWFMSGTLPPPPPSVWGGQRVISRIWRQLSLLPVRRTWLGSRSPHPSAGGSALYCQEEVLPHSAHLT